MRLIDADELRKRAIPCEIHNGALTDMCVPLYQIDNAPTVEYPFYQEAYQTGYEEGKNEKPTINCKDCDGYEAGYSAGLKDAERPQGEWVRKEDIIHYIATQYSEHNELVPVWLNIGDLIGGAE